MKRHVKIITIDLEDSSLDSAAGVIEDQTNKVLSELQCRRCTIVSVTPIPLATMYTIPGEPGTLRDYSYTERGIMVMVTYDAPRKGEPTK